MRLSHSFVGRPGRVIRYAVSLVVGVGLALGVALTGATAATSDPHLTESAVTKTGSGRFADLSVTVGKTKHLGNEAVKVAWQWGGADPGSHATVDATRWKWNYLQIFQCWGDDTEGPRREQCQFGANFSADSPYRQVSPFDQPGFTPALSRIVGDVDVQGTVVADLVDPLESGEGGYPPVAGKGQAGRGVVPMHAAPTEKFPTGQVIPVQPSTADTGEAFDIFGTNEIPVARTNAVGGGSVYFEAQTLYQSQFLGCGGRLPQGDGSAKGRQCWLVVVPRDSLEVTGVDQATRSGTTAMGSSPLSLTNWAQRIVFPLDFEPVRQACTIGGVERPVVGHESLGSAMRSWQPALCQAGQGFFYATTTDDIARSTVSGDLPKLSVITDPLPGTSIAAENGAAVYAPVAVSGVSIGFFIERAYSNQRPGSTLANTGTRVEKLRLNQRIVAKLLTESYRQSTIVRDDGPEHLRANPPSILSDPEFRQLNQDLLGAWSVNDLDNVPATLARLYVPPDASDAVRLLWTWVLGDRRARAFLDGTPDEWGMSVNEYYKGLDRYVTDGVVRADIPKLEEACATVPIGTNVTDMTKVCALDAAPFVASFEEGAMLTARGQPKGSESPYREPGTGLIKFPKPNPQVVGLRALLTLTDTPSAEVRGLVQAELPNADGRYLAPTRDSMEAALGQAGLGAVPTVERIDPTRMTGAAYPLTRISYAATNAAKLDDAARKDYAQFIRVASTTGQVPGTAPGNLPLGYAPLTPDLQAAAEQAAKDILTAALPPARAQPNSSPPVTTSAPGSLDSGTLFAGPSMDGLGPDVASLDAVLSPDLAAPAAKSSPLAAVLARFTPYAAGTGWLLPVLALAALGLAVASRLLLAGERPVRWPWPPPRLRLSGR